MNCRMNGLLSKTVFLSVLIVLVCGFAASVMGQSAPLGKFHWNSVTTGPNFRDEADIVITVSDYSPAQVRVDVTVNLVSVQDDDEIDRAYVKLGSTKQYIFDGLISGQLGNIPYSTTLYFNKPGSPQKWVLGYENYIDYSYQSDTGKGIEESRQLPDTVSPVSGNYDGVHSWVLPYMPPYGADPYGSPPQGLSPTQSWHCTGSSPDGDIYQGGMDHTNNSSLFRLTASEGDIADRKLRYVGDALTAAIMADTWYDWVSQVGKPEYFEKFHTRPFYNNGKMYVTNMSASYPNDPWQSIPGFHWFAYDKSNESFEDILGNGAFGIGQIVSLTADPVYDRLYGASVPEGKIFEHDLNYHETYDLNRPYVKHPNYHLAQDIIYAARVLWIDSKHRLYFSMGKDWYGDPDIPGEYQDPVETCGYLHYIDIDDPSPTWVKTNMQLQVSGHVDSIEVGQWSRDHTRFYCMDDKQRIYRFTDNGPTPVEPSWDYLGQATRYGDGAESWVFHVSPDEKKIYIVHSVWNISSLPRLLEFDIDSGTTTVLRELRQMDNDGVSTCRFGQRRRHTGYDAWDNHGGFYFASFNGDDGSHVILTGVNPARLKADAFGTTLVEVDLQTVGGQFNITRNTTQNNLEVLYELHTIGTQEHTYYGQTTIEQGQTVKSLTVTDLNAIHNITDSPASYVLTVIPDGNDYVVDAYQNTGSLQGDMPPLPTNLVAEAFSSPQLFVRLTWQDNASGPEQEDSYTIQRKPVIGSTAWQTIATLPANTTTYDDYDYLHGLIQYTYRVGADRN